MDRQWSDNQQLKRNELLTYATFICMKECQNVFHERTQAKNTYIHTYSIICENF